MKIIPIAIASLVLLAGGELAAQAEKPESMADRASYGIGLNLGQRLAAQQVAVNVELLAQGVRDALAGEASLLTQEEVSAALRELDAQVKARAEAMLAELGRRNLAEGATALEANAKLDGVVVTESGLQYQVLTAGTGASPTEADHVTVHYQGSLLNGNVFDSSYERGEPVTFPVTGVIPGWVEALQLMKEGAKWRLWIPGELAYGDRGRAPQIGPNAVLVFDVELIKVGA